MRYAIGITCIGYMAIGTFVACHHWPGELPNGRWEWAIGTHERITSVIKLEDQHGE